MAMAAQNSREPQDDDFFELHLRRMLDAPSFEKEAPHAGMQWSASKEAAMRPVHLSASEASTLSSDGRGADAYASSCSGRDALPPPPPTSCTPPSRGAAVDRVIFESPVACTPNSGPLTLRSQSRLSNHHCRQPEPEPDFPRHARGHAVADLSNQAVLRPSDWPPHDSERAQPCHEGARRNAGQADRSNQASANDCPPPPPEPPRGQPAHEERQRVNEGRRQQVGQAFVIDRTPTEDNEKLLAGSFCGFVHKTAAENHSSAPASKPPAKSKNKKLINQAPRCVQCHQLAAGRSSLDHVCPPCGAVVCSACVDDFRLIIKSYRCPRCGEETENQELLQSTAWLRSVLRSASAMYTNFTMSWSKLLTPSEEVVGAQSRESGVGATPMTGWCYKDVPRSRGVPVGATPTPGLCGKGLQVENVEICGGVPAASRSDASKSPPDSRDVQQLSKAQLNVAAKSAARPEHRTRVPVGWDEAMLPQRGGEDIWSTVPPKQ